MVKIGSKTNWINKETLQSLYIEQGLDLQNIADLFGKQKSQVHRLLKSWEIKARPRSWRGGRWVDGYGYIFVHSPNNPMSNSIGYIMEHRLVMAQHLGRMLDRSELVHHINGIKTDNRIENLEITNRSEHSKLHSAIYHPKDTNGRFIKE